MALGWGEGELKHLFRAYLRMLQDELAGRSYSKVEYNREVPSNPKEPDDASPVREYVIVRTGGFTSDGTATVNKRGWAYKPTIEMIVACKSPDQVGAALFSLLDRIDALICQDRRLGFPQGSGMIDAQIESGEPDPIDAAGSSPGGALIVEVVAKLQTTRTRLSAAA